MILDSFNRVPLVVVLSAFASYPLQACPRASCRSSRLLIQDDHFHCYACGAGTTGGAFVGAYLWDWTFEQYAQVFDLERIGREAGNV